MWRYLKAAFWFKPELPLIGAVPINPIFLTCCAILGVGNPGFWLLGLGVDLAFVFTMASNPRFQRWHNIQARNQLAQVAEAQRQVLIEGLSDAARARLQQQQAQLEKILELFRRADADADAVARGRQALSELLWNYLKLLVARDNLQASRQQRTIEGLEREIALLEGELQAEQLAMGVQQSKQATLAILHDRKQHLLRRNEALQEIESELQRIQARFDLALDQATLQGSIPDVSVDIDLLGARLDSDFLGLNSPVVCAIDQTYGRARRLPGKQ